MIDGHGLGTVTHLKHLPAGSPGGAGEVVEEVVLDDDVVGAPAGCDVVRAQDVHAARRVADDIVLERDVLHDHPWRSAALVARRENNREAGLIGHPEVLEHVALD